MGGGGVLNVWGGGGVLNVWGGDSFQGESGAWGRVQISGIIAHLMFGLILTLASEQ